MDPAQLLRTPDEDAPAVTRIWAEPEEQQLIGEALLALGMLEELPDLSHTPISACGRKISLGTYGVGKAKSDPIIIGDQLMSVLRLVINGVPLNACLIPLLLDCLQLWDSAAGRIVPTTQSQRLAYQHRRPQCFLLPVLPSWNLA